MLALAFLPTPGSTLLSQLEFCLGKLTQKLIHYSFFDYYRGGKTNRKRGLGLSEVDLWGGIR
jgi:hypothetical protein